MVEYNPRGELPIYEDTTEEENYKLKRSLDILFNMIIKGRSLVDIQKVAARLADEHGWPYLRKAANTLEMSIEEEELEDLADAYDELVQRMKEDLMGENEE